MKKVSILCIIIGLLLLSFSTYEYVSSVTIKNSSHSIVEELEETEEVDKLVGKLQYYFKNKDIVGYLYFSEVGVEYPIAQAEDNDFYLKHNIYGSYSNAGSIFLDYENHSDFMDESSIVYGHHMRNGTMFGDLEEKTQSTDEDMYFTVYTRDKKIVYKVIEKAVIQPEERSKYLKNSISNKPRVTLMTCHYTNGETVRYGVTGEAFSIEEY